MPLRELSGHHGPGPGQQSLGQHVTARREQEPWCLFPQHPSPSGHRCGTARALARSLHCPLTQMPSATELYSPGHPGVSGPGGHQACPSVSGSRCPQQYMGRGCHCPCREMGWPSPGVYTWTSPSRQLSWGRRGAGEGRPSQHRSWWVLQGSGSLWGGVHRCQSSFQQGCALPQIVSFLAHPCRCPRSVSSRARAAAEVVGRVSTRRLLQEPLPAVRLQGVVCRPPCVSQPAHRHRLGAGRPGQHKPQAAGLRRGRGGDAGQGGSGVPNPGCDP